MSECADGEKIEVLLSEETIKTRVKEMALEISGDYRGKQVTLIGTLKGAVFFLTDLSRELGLEQEIDFVKASSYGKDSVSSGNVKIELYPSDSIKNKHVLWIEDIIDTGNTAVKLSEYIQEQKPASLALVSLLDKPSRRVHRSLRIDYLGFTIPDEFVVGYGLDYAGKYRNLPYVGILRFKNK